MYKCKECNLEVIMFNEKGELLPTPLKACTHNAPIIMDMVALNVTGNSQFKQK